MCLVHYLVKIELAKQNIFSKMVEIIYKKVKNLLSPSKPFIVLIAAVARILFKVNTYLTN